MIHRNRLILVLALATGIAGSAQAASPSGRSPVDTNRDGVITRAEAAARPGLAARFDALDTNRDGRLQASERPRGGRHHRGGFLQRLVKLDVNADGRISRLEAANSPMANRFDMLDANRDGYLVRAELQAGMERMRSQKSAQREQKARERFTQADRNRDGRLSRDEAQQAMPKQAQAFAFLDNNRDGFLTADELRFGRRR